MKTLEPHYDYLIVGAGFSGVVLAERLSTQLGKRCLIVDRRPHVAGNCYDQVDEHGVLVHRYGPHYFRTNSQRVIDYLSRFTEWLPMSYQIKSWTHGRYWNFPVNLNTFEQIIGRPSTEAEFRAYLEERRVPIQNPKNSEDVIVSQVGRELFEMFFKGYTFKQWRKYPHELDASVCARIPIRFDRDDRYLKEQFQALPAKGYTQVINRMLESCHGVDVLLSADFREVKNQVSYSKLIYTGPLDEYFDHRFGVLPYRSLRFEWQGFEEHELADRLPIAGKKGFWQPAVQVNYPNDHGFTRIVEAKHITGQTIGNTTIVREYPEDYALGKEPYYPVPTGDAQIQFAKYRDLSLTEKDTIFAGRLATYRYLNMDQIVEEALKLFDAIKSEFVSRAA